MDALNAAAIKHHRGLERSKGRMGDSRGVPRFDPGPLQQTQPLRVVRARQRADDRQAAGQMVTSGATTSGRGGVRFT